MYADFVIWRVIMAEKKFSVTLKEIIDEFHLESIHLPMDASKLLVIETEINRPGLQLSGFYEYFNNERIQILPPWRKA